MKTQQGNLLRAASVFSSVLSLLLIVAANRSLAEAQDSSKTNASREVLYRKEIAPFLDKFCATCHNADDQHPSELYMDSYETLMKGGKHGKAIMPGSADSSLMIIKLGPNPPFGKSMPPGNKRKPTPQQIELLRTWIDQGAKNN